MHAELSRRTRDERGAFGLLFGVLLGTGVLFGLVALSFDYGLINVDHSELQASADGAALKAAQICVAGGICPSAADNRLTSISQANDSGSKHSSQVALLCGNAPDIDGPPAACPGFNDSRITTCPAPTLNGSPWAGDYVNAYTTKQTDHVFAGGGSTEGHACAAVAWGRAQKNTGELPITFSYCEWKAATGGDPLAGTGNYAPSPPYPPYPDGSLQQVIYLNAPNDDTAACPNWNGHDDPGGFGWLDSGGTCGNTVSVDDWVHVDTGNNTPNPCKTVLDSLVNTVIDVPVFDCQNSVAGFPADLDDCVTGGNGSNHYYHIVGFAGFYLTGWHLSGSSHASAATGSAPCSGSDRCLSGFFVKHVVSGGIDDGGGGQPNFGLTAIQTIG